MADRLLSLLASGRSARNAGIGVAGAVVVRLGKEVGANENACEVLAAAAARSRYFALPIPVVGLQDYRIKKARALP
jgi:hypothetical protein